MLSGGSLARQLGLSNSNRHVDLWCRMGKFQLSKVRTNQNLAEELTKNLSIGGLHRLLSKLRLHTQTVEMQALTTELSREQLASFQSSLSSFYIGVVSRTPMMEQQLDLAQLERTVFKQELGLAQLELEIPQLDACQLELQSPQLDAYQLELENPQLDAYQLELESPQLDAYQLELENPQLDAYQLERTAFRQQLDLAQLERIDLAQLEGIDLAQLELEMLQLDAYQLALERPASHTSLTKLTEERACKESHQQLRDAPPDEGSRALACGRSSTAQGAFFTQLWGKESEEHLTIFCGFTA